MIIRRAKPEEAQATIEFYHDLIDTMKGRPIRPTWTKGVYPLLSDIQEAAENGWLYVAVQEDREIIGAVVVNDRQGQGYSDVDWPIPTDAVAVIHLLASKPNLHGQGIGRKLLEQARKAALDMNADVIRLDTLPYNAPARHLYESFGFNYCGDLDLSYPSVGTIPFSMYEYDLGRNRKILVSACLAGEYCRWDGGTNLVPEIKALVDSGNAVAVCPEELGGLPMPRLPCERLGGSVVNSEGANVTAEFRYGAEEALWICKEHGCKLAILKSKSPSCGKGLIHNGLFDGGLVPGNGVTAQLLMEDGVTVLTEQDWLSTIRRRPPQPPHSSQLHS